MRPIIVILLEIKVISYGINNLFIFEREQGHLRAQLFHSPHSSICRLRGKIFSTITSADDLAGNILSDNKKSFHDGETTLKIC